MNDRPENPYRQITKVITTEGQMTLLFQELAWERGFSDGVLWMGGMYNTTKDENEQTNN